LSEKEKVLAYWEAIRQACEKCKLKAPSAEQVREAVLDNLSSAQAAKGKAKWLKKSRSEKGTQLQKWLDWHKSPGNLTAPIMWSMQYPDNELWENLALVHVKAGRGKGSQALDNWKSALGGRL